MAKSMTIEGTIEEALTNAVDEAFDDWASEHPSMANVIERIKITEPLATSLRKSPQYKAAAAAYHRSSLELELAGRLLDLAKTFLPALLW